MDYEAVIGLETHVQLKTRTKIWCGCRNTYGSEPNHDVCPVCLGYPGSLPVLNREAVRLTVLAGMLLNCEINTNSKWDRKNYFYPDMPKNYQISQYDQPLCIGGSVNIVVDDKPRAVQLTRIHLEEDVGKSTHIAGGSLLDFNRAGTPLMEIVTEPDLHTADEAYAYLQALKQILLYGNISEGNLEEGNIRCDINVSVRPKGQSELGVKAEIKNMNTFKGVHRALQYEIRRQTEALKRGDKIIQETRRWDDETGRTESMRTKEEAHDYRYFPEPDLVPVLLSPEQLDDWRSHLPELPEQRRARVIDEYGLPEYDAGVLVADKAVADYFEEAAKASGNFKSVSNWVMTEVMRVLSEQDIEIGEFNIKPGGLAALIKLVDDKTINMPSAKEVFAIMTEEGGDPVQIVKDRGMVQVSDSGAIEALADKVIAENEKSANDFRAGKEAALQFLVGQVMRHSKGKANPKMAAEVLRGKLSG